MSDYSTPDEYAAWRQARRAALRDRWTTEEPTPEFTAACERLGRILGGAR